MSRRVPEEAEQTQVDEEEEEEEEVCNNTTIRRGYRSRKKSRGRWGWVTGEPRGAEGIS